MLKKTRFRRTRLFVAAGILVFASPLILSAVTFAADDTIIVPGPLSPRKISIPFVENSADVYLTDSTGLRIPLTGNGTQIDDGQTSIFPPKLAHGSYTITYPGGTKMFSVGDTLLAESASRNLPLIWVVTGSVLFLGIILFATRRRVLALGCTLVAIMLPFAFTMFSPTLDTQAPDPCLGIYDDTASKRCMFEHIQAVLNTDGAAQAVDRLTVLSARANTSWGLACHELAHSIGQRVWREASKTENLVKAGTLSCGFGYFHGLLESVGMYSTDSDFPGAALTVCAALEKHFPYAEKSGSIVECMHGIGHASMWRYNENLLAARRVCAGLSKELWQRECDAGSIMSWVFAREASRTENRPQDAPEPVVNKALDLCSPPLGTPTPGCVSGALFGTLKDEYTDSVTWCLKNPDQRDICVSSLRMRIVTWISWDEVEKYDGPGESRKLCETLYADSTRRQLCISEISWYHLQALRDYRKTQIFCLAVGAEYAEGCRRGILLFYSKISAVGDAAFGEVPPDVLAELEEMERDKKLCETLSANSDERQACINELVW